MNSRFDPKTAGVLLLAAACLAPLLHAADKSEKPRRRLPDHFAKLGLTDDQRDRISVVQDRYGARIEQLERELADLKARRTAGIRRVLNLDQRRKLDRLTAEDEAKRRKPDPPVSQWGDVPEDPVVAPLPDDQ